MNITIVHLIAAARPNFMKVAPLYRALKGEGWCRPIVVHTGQHYGASMSDAFFRDLALPAPEYHLGVGSGSHAEQTAGVLVAYERLCLEHRPDWTVVVGDVNSTMACVLAAKKLNLPVAHLEAGLRSFDRSMPEEINRVVTDGLADLLWTPSPDADENLRREGIPDSRIERVGNVMIDALELMRPQIEAARMPQTIGLAPGSYGVVTLHRPSNVDTAAALAPIVDALAAAADRVPLVFPVHPRTRERLHALDLATRLERHTRIHILPPLGYVDFLSLLVDAALAITDSGGIQEETTHLGVPCLTLRDTTERPITITQGTNQLIRVEGLITAIERTLSTARARTMPPALWDGKAAIRAATSLRRAAGATT